MFCYISNGLVILMKIIDLILISHTAALKYAKNSLIYCQNDFLNLTEQKNIEKQVFREKVFSIYVFNLIFTQGSFSSSCFL